MTPSGGQHLPGILNAQFAPKRVKTASGADQLARKLRLSGAPRDGESLIFDYTARMVPKASHRCELPSLAFVDDLERIPVRVKYIGGVVSRIVFHSCPR